MTNFRSAVFVLIAGAAAVAYAADEFPVPYNTEKGAAGQTPQPISPDEALSRIKLPNGFRATLFAAEPEVQNPIAMSFDSRGRLWVAENYTYADRPQRFDLRLRDRLLIFEDRDGDGRADSRKVFTDKLQMLSSVVHGYGGVWVMCPPALLFIPDRNGDDVPDGEPEVVLDGFVVAQENYHTFANGLKWGPDGWLYGRCGASCPGEIGVPGTPAEKRVPVRGGMWRFSPRTRAFETLTFGTTNPWGHDWDEHGELFFINTVNGHLWHMFPGAHFVRPHSLACNPRVYEAIDQHADHWHFDTGKGWMASRDGAANDLGGGHAHSGMLIYHGDNWPAAYRGKLLTINFHGRRINVERLERSGSGFVGRHEPDFALFGDPWFRGIELTCGPDGNVMVLDWSDTGECHEANGIHRTSGRIYKIVSTNGPAERRPIADVAALPAAELAALHRHNNEVLVREARRILIERRAAGTDVSTAIAPLRDQLGGNQSAALRLRAVWTLRLLGAIDDDQLQTMLHDGDEHVRAWAIRLLTDDWPLDLGTGGRPGRPDVQPPQKVYLEFVRLAKEDASGLVRLTLASTLQRLPVDRRADLASALVSRSVDANDHNLPLLVWFGLIPLGDRQPAALVNLFGTCQWPTTRRMIARRLTEDIEKNAGPLDALLALAVARPPAVQADLLAGMSEALAGWRKARKPGAWDALQQKLASDSAPSSAKSPASPLTPHNSPLTSTALHDRARDLSVLFGDGRALDEVRRIALDDKVDLVARKQALQALVDARPPDLRSICEKVLDVRYLNTIAARGLALNDDAEIGRRLVRSYRSFAIDDRPQVVGVLVSRAAWAGALLEAIKAGRFPRNDLSAYHARQIRALGDEAIDRQLVEAWGELRDSPADKRDLIERLKGELTPVALSRADASHGRALFVKACAACHTLYGEGGKRGPDLTGAQRQSLDYLLENIVDPSAAVPAEYRVSVFTLADGRTLSGIVSARTDRTLTIMTQTDTLSIERADIEDQKESPQSLMPDGLLQTLSPEQVRELFAYLMTRQQVALPAGSESP